MCQCMSLFGNSTPLPFRLHSLLFLLYSTCNLTLILNSCAALQVISSRRTQSSFLIFLERITTQQFGPSRTASNLVQLYFPSYSVLPDLAQQFLFCICYFCFQSAFRREVAAPLASWCLLEGVLGSAWGSLLPKLSSFCSLLTCWGISSLSFLRMNAPCLTSGGLPVLCLRSRPIKLWHVLGLELVLG